MTASHHHWMHTCPSDKWHHALPSTRRGVVKEVAVGAPDSFRRREGASRGLGSPEPFRCGRADSARGEVAPADGAAESLRSEGGLGSFHCGLRVRALSARVALGDAGRTVWLFTDCDIEWEMEWMVAGMVAGSVSSRWGESRLAPPPFGGG